MIVTRFLSSIDDWINPIVVKELRQAVKSRMVVSILMTFLFLQMALLSLALAGTEQNQIGRTIFAWQQGFLLWTLMLLVPIYAATRLSAERSDQNVDLLFISTLRPRSIITGKFFAALVLAVLIFSTCAPFMIFSYLLRGIDIPTVLVVLGIDLLGMLLGTIIALCVAAISVVRPVKFFLIFLMVMLLILLSSWGSATTIELVSRGMGFYEDFFDPWLVLAGTAAYILGMVGLFFAYSVALISPASSNRMLPVRLFLVFSWLGLGMGASLIYFLLTSKVHLVPLAFWIGGACLSICFQFSISICEREQWGPRMARTIPRSRLLRPLAWLFYTGAGGGVTLTVLLAAATLGGGWIWTATWGEDWLSGLDELKFAYTFLDVLTILCLYCYCYGMSALLIRRRLPARQMKPEFTWLIALLLFGLASAIPQIIAVFVYANQRYPSHAEWWSLPNPFVWVAEVGMENRGMSEIGYRDLCYAFLGTWSLAVTALSVPWYLGQVRRFHPPAAAKPSPAEPAEVVQVTEAPVETTPAPSVEAG